MILSGLRVFDIRDPQQPAEIAYFNAPVTRASPAGASDAEQLGDVEPVVRPGARRDLVLRRPQRLLRRAIDERSVRPLPGGRRASLPGAPLADRTAEHRAYPNRLHPRAASAAARAAGPRKTRRSNRYCVKGSSGRVTAVFSKRGRVVLVTTTARAHGNRGLRPGAPGGPCVAPIPGAAPGAGALPREPPQPAPDRRSGRPRAVLRGGPPEPPSQRTGAQAPPPARPGCSTDTGPDLGSTNANRYYLHGSAWR